MLPSCVFLLSRRSVSSAILLYSSSADLGPLHPEHFQLASALENNYPPIRVIVTVSFEDIAQPWILTFFGLSKVTALEALHHSSSAAFIDYSSYAVLHSQSYSQPSPSFHPCSLSNITACRHREPQPSFPSILPTCTSSTRLMEFTGAAAPYRLNKLYLHLSYFSLNCRIYGILISKES